MKRGKKSLALMLAVAMVFSSVPVSAASMRAGSYTNSWFGNFWSSLFNWNWSVNSSKDDTIVEVPEQEAEKELAVVEDATTVENGDLLRASTYSLRTADAGEATETAAAYDADDSSTEAEAESTTVKYFPVTMYDYDTDKINAATDALDDDTTVREGIYFSGGSPEYTKTEEIVLPAGQYYIQNIRAKNNNVGSWLQAHKDNKIYADTKENATVWTLSIEDGEYYLTTKIDGIDNYMIVGTNGHDDGYTTTKTPISITAFSGDSSGVQLSQDGYYLCQWGASNAQEFGGYAVNNDDGNGMLFYPVDSDGAESDTPVVPVVESYISSGYEEWNRWDKASGANENGDLIYTGLVQNTLVDDQIVFRVNEGGIFSYDAAEVVDTAGNVNENASGVKKVYEYIGLPFVLDEETGVYTFDSDENGAYFADPADGTAQFRSGTATEPMNLYFAEGNPQPMPTDLSVGDGSTNAWFPFNAESGYSTSQVNYHIGMRADLPFSMTSNGRIKSTDDESDPITFTFSGDDDVWVFIDGVLVIDLGGIHNRLDATIDFAANTVTYSEGNSQDADTDTGSYNDSDFMTTQKLFTDAAGTGLINSTRDAFAGDEDHEMSVFYLERGEGTSNCRIEFNLPMNDTVLVTKDATQSWSASNQDDEDEGVDKLTASEQAIINNIDFGFTLYKKNAGEETFSPVANTNYYLSGNNIEGAVIGSTDENGHFYLRNGQTAKFITDISNEGVTYYVVEDAVPDGFVTPDFHYNGEAASGFDYDGTDGLTHVTAGNLIPEQEIALDAATNKSYEVTVYGSIEASDSVEFICSNFLNAELPNPSAFAYEDIIVIDYGLPVCIDPLANDVFRGDSAEIVYVGGEDVTLNVNKEDGEITTATWVEDNTYDSGKVELNDVTYQVTGSGEDAVVTRDTLTYTLDKQLTEVEVISYIIQVTGSDIQDATNETLLQYDYAIGRVYIVPATVMYYEENFANLVTFTGTGWEGEIKDASYESAYQEPGVVGTIDDSTYGSDVAYLSDSEDSNGTSYHGDTTNGAIRFSYTFTGTGTSFFARTSATTGYMQIKLYEGADTSGEQLNLTYRDTYYKDENDSSEDAAGTLYNIPVYTESDLDYGTYTVVATIAKAGTKTAGNENGSGKDFYLDGIRIMQPLHEATELRETVDEQGEAVMEEVYTAHTEKALGAYAADGESNIEVVTLRQKLITDAELGETPWNFAVLTDINGAVVTAEDYTSIGPKEEVYLENGQSVSFAIKYWHQDGYKMHLGMKAPFGTGTAQVGQTTYNLANAADCYYDITGNHSSVVVKYEQAMDEDGNLFYTDANGVQVYEDMDGNLTYADGSAVAEDAVLTPVDDTNFPYYVATYTIAATNKIVALTNIKVTGNYEFAVVEDVDINIDIEDDTNGGELE